MARPLVPIDWKVVDELLEGGSCGVEIAGHFGVTDETFYDRFKKERQSDTNFSSFSLYAASKKSSGNAQIRLKQYKSALEGNTEMLKRLGDVRLGQSNKSNNLDESSAKEILGDAIREFIRDSQNLSQPQGFTQPKVETQQPLQDQRSAGPNDSVQDELGPGKVIC